MSPLERSLPVTLFVGCYTNESPAAIRVFNSSPQHPQLAQTSAIETIRHASFLAAHPNGRVLYAVSEIDSFAGAKSGGIYALAIDPTDSSLSLISEVPSRGIGPCHVSVAPSGDYLFVANYMSGSFATYAVQSDGTIGAFVGDHQQHGSGPTARQEGPHAHCIVPGRELSSGARPTYGVDLGTDRIIQFRDARDTSGTATSTMTAASTMTVDAQLGVDAGVGPRHITFHPTRPLAFIAGELNSTIITAHVNLDTGNLDIANAYSTLPDDFSDQSTVAEVLLHPNGRFVYVSNRGHDSIATFELDAADATLSARGWTPSGGKNPRHFTLDPAGETMIVANEHSNSLTLLAVDPTTGELRPTGETLPASAPVCALFVAVAQ